MVLRRTVGPRRVEIRRSWRNGKMRGFITSLFTKYY
jgi:hypothetical protein